MTNVEKATFLMSLGHRFEQALTLGIEDENYVAVPLTREEVETVLECIDPEAGEAARIVRGIFLRVRRKMSAEDN